MRKIYYLIFCLSIYFCTNGYAADYFSISDIGVSAQAISSGYIEGIHKKPFAVFENPAMLNNDDIIAVSIFQTTFDNDLQYLNAALSTSTKYGVFGAGIMGAYVGGLVSSKQNEYNQFEEDYTFDYATYIGKLSYQTPKISSLLHFPVPFTTGASLSYTAGTADTITSKGIDLDVGAAIELSNLQISAALHNILGSSVTYTGTIKDSESTESDPLKDISYSEKETLAKKGIIAANYTFKGIQLKSHVKLYKGQALRAYGITTKVPWIDSLEFSAGNRTYLVNDSIVSSNTFGLSLLFNQIGFHYAIEKSDSLLLDYKHYFSIDLQFKK